MSEKYTGKIFDAMVQVDSEQEFNLILNNNTSWVDKFCVFYRENFDKDLSSDTIIMGTTKSRNQRFDISQDYLNSILSEIQQYDCKFVGELMLSHADKTGGQINLNSERYIDSAAPNLLKLLEEVHVPIMIHWEVYNLERDLYPIENMLAKNLNKTFIWPHCGFAHPEFIDDLLTKHDNLIGTLSKLELIRSSDSWISPVDGSIIGQNVANPDYLDKLNMGMLDEVGNIKPEWKSLLEKHSNRFMFATDSHKDFRHERYGDIVNIWRDILGNFDKEVAEKIAYGNAMKVYRLQ